MAELSRFLGIVVYMLFNDHNPPHFHVKYGEYKASITINDFALLNGDLPSRIHGYVIEWASMHKQELIENWNMLQTAGKISKIKPLV